MEGAFGVCFVFSDQPDLLIGARRGSPLLVGVGDGEYFLASDASAILEHTKTVEYLNESEMVVISRVGYVISSLDAATPVSREHVLHRLEMSLEAIEKGGYKHFMLKEIMEQPVAIANAMRGRVNVETGDVRLGGLMGEPLARLSRARRIIIAACGTSFHSGLVGEYLIESLARIPVEVEYASEFRYRKVRARAVAWGGWGVHRALSLRVAWRGACKAGSGGVVARRTAPSLGCRECSAGLQASACAAPPPVHPLPPPSSATPSPQPILFPDDVLVVISQSGETADTLAAVREAKAHNVMTLGIVNTVGSSIARETDAGAYLHVGPEIGVASTKAFTGQVLLLTMMALMIGKEKGLIDAPTMRRYVDALAAIPSQMQSVLSQAGAIENMARSYRYAQSFLYLGRGYNFPVALEGALKLKEISYIHAEGYAAAEMKHGPIALIDRFMPVVIIAPKSDNTYDKIRSNIEEVSARGGSIIVVTEDGNHELDAKAEAVLFTPHTEEFLSPLLTVVPLQLLSYHIATLRKLDVDQVSSLPGLHTSAPARVRRSLDECLRTAVDLAHLTHTFNLVRSHATSPSR